ncbi:dipeptidase [Paenibacillus provencensis]|uniref:Dipeptidase n=1 Tax=Paenibacillus provencensis TaxID=441151 RepID=A0ABW3PWG3_9BACL|nr:membrane dipeptidase [Paenibacillus sp. MER 78]MCM3128792.1 dipeptidase [Paenibacillus sp. MER 78]
MPNHIPVVDMHCDVLSKIQMNSELQFLNGPGLDVTQKRLEEGNVILQTFAIYLSEKLGILRFEHIMKQIEIYNQLGLRLVQSREDVSYLRKQLNNLRGGQWGLLSLEGVDGLEGNLYYLELCYRLGVRFIGITWNYANWAADGILEVRNGGFTNKGRTLIQRCNEIGMLMDVSHLSETGFWELADASSRPFIASHSNARSICPHPRNLTNDQIRAVIALDGRIGMTFVPWFIKEKGPVNASDLLKHIERVCELGGEKHLMFGSDFDGIHEWIQGLEHSGTYPELVNLLLKHYPESVVRGFMYDNILSFMEENLNSKELCSD